MSESQPEVKRSPWGGVIAVGGFVVATGLMTPGLVDVLDPYSDAHQARMDIQQDLTLAVELAGDPVATQEGKQDLDRRLEDVRVYLDSAAVEAEESGVDQELQVAIDTALGNLPETGSGSGLLNQNIRQSLFVSTTEAQELAAEEVEPYWDLEHSQGARNLQRAEFALAVAVVSTVVAVVSDRILNSSNSRRAADQTA